MPRIAFALVLALIGAGAQAALVLLVLQPLFHLSGGALTIPVLVGTIFAAVFGLVTGWTGVYALRPRSVWNFLIDVTWSALNTVTGLVFLIFCLAKGTHQPPSEISQDRGAIWYTGAALGGAGATTIGTVMGGQWLAHETVHIQQARLFGPFYWPVYLASYVANMLMRFVTGRFADPHWEAYGRVVMEDWAYHAAPGPRVEVAPSLLWFGLALLNAVALGAIFGLAAIPWWIGLVVLLGYALGRSFFAKAN